MFVAGFLAVGREQKRRLAPAISALQDGGDLPIPREHLKKIISLFSDRCKLFVFF